MLPGEDAPGSTLQLLQRRRRRSVLRLACAAAVGLSASVAGSQAATASPAQSQGARGQSCQLYTHGTYKTLQNCTLLGPKDANSIVTRTGRTEIYIWNILSKRSAVPYMYATISKDRRVVTIGAYPPLKVVWAEIGFTYSASKNSKPSAATAKRVGTFHSKKPVQRIYIATAMTGTLPGLPSTKPLP